MFLQIGIYFPLETCLGKRAGVLIHRTVEVDVLQVELLPLDAQDAFASRSRDSRVTVRTGLQTEHPAVSLPYCLSERGIGRYGTVIPPPVRGYRSAHCALACYHSAQPE